MRLYCRVFFCFFISVSTLNILSAQDSTSSQLSASNAISFYNKFIGGDAHLYNGSDHGPYDFRIKGDAYFHTNLLQAGSLNYDGVTYEQVGMAYDIVRDELTANRYNNNYRMSLVTAKIAWFSLFNHFFVRLSPDTTNKVITPGFYDRLYDGKMKLYAKRQKKIMETVTAEEGDKLWFEQHDLYFIMRNNKYYSIKDKNDLFDFFKDRKKDLKRFLRKNKISFKEDPELAILRSIEYYDQLKN